MLNKVPFLKMPVVRESQNRHTVEGTSGAVTALDSRQSIENVYETLVNINAISRLIPLESVDGRPYCRVILAPGDSFPCAWSLEFAHQQIKDCLRISVQNAERWAMSASMDANK